MAVARVVSFTGVDRARLDEMSRRMQEGGPPEGLSPTEIIVLHDPEAEESLALVFFESEDDYRRGDEVLNAMPAEDTPGRRTSVRKYDVAFRVAP